MSGCGEQRRAWLSGPDVPAVVHQVVREAARANTLPQMRVDIVPAKFSDDAPLWGAIALAEKMQAER